VSPATRSKAGILDFLTSPPDSPPPLIVIYGKEHLLADRAISAILQAAVPDETLRDLNID